jgi:hypothetical protein
MAQSSTLIGAEIDIKTVAALHSECRCWVKSGKAQIEQMLSALPAIADIGRAFLNVRVVPRGDIAANRTRPPSKRRKWQQGRESPALRGLDACRGQQKAPRLSILSRRRDREDRGSEDPNDAKCDFGDLDLVKLRLEQRVRSPDVASLIRATLAGTIDVTNCTPN